MTLSSVSLMQSRIPPAQRRDSGSCGPVPGAYSPDTHLRGEIQGGLKSRPEQKSLLEVLPPGKRARLHRLLFEFGPGNGTLMLLPIDQGIEHGPRDFFPNPASKDPDYQFRLAAEAGYSALACQIGMAEKYYPDYAGRVPLILKVNGKTDLPSSAKAFSSCNASEEDGVRPGPATIAYALS